MNPIAMNHRQPRLTTLMVTLGFSLLLVTGCDAQKPAADAASSVTEGKPYSEPALVLKVIDQETKLPVVGALVYGHYATSTGTLAGGTRLGEFVKSFEAVTDANGNATLEAWTTGERKVQGLPNGKFPVVAVYKPGYDLETQSLNSIREFRSRTNVSGGGKAEATEATVDWTKYPFELRPLKTEKERYDALSNAGTPMMMVGECGWEAYAGILLAQHVEWKDFLKRNVPAQGLDARGYKQSNYSHPNRDWMLSGTSALDRIIDKYPAEDSAQRCMDPTKLTVKKKL